MTERDLNRGSGFTPGSSPTSGSNTPGTTGGASGSTVKATATDAAHAASATAAQTGNDLKQKLNEDWQSAKSAAQSEIGHAKQFAQNTADEQKNFAAERVSGFAAAIEKVGNELEQGDQRDQREIGRYAKQIGSSIHRFADDMKDKDMAQIAGMAEDFGRRQPAAFIGIAALAGFAASRFLTATTERRAGQSNTASGGMGGMGGGTTRNTASPATSTPAAPTSVTTPVSPATGTGYATGYSPEGKNNV